MASSARVPRYPGPVETTHPHRTEKTLGHRMVHDVAEPDHGQARLRPVFLGAKAPGTRMRCPVQVPRSRRPQPGPASVDVPTRNGFEMNASWADHRTAVDGCLRDGPRGTCIRSVPGRNVRPGARTFGQAAGPPASIDLGRTSTRGRGTHLTLGRIAERPRRRAQRRARQLTSQATGSV